MVLLEYTTFKLINKNRKQKVIFIRILIRFISGLSLDFELQIQYTLDTGLHISYFVKILVTNLPFSIGSSSILHFSDIWRLRTSIWKEEILSYNLLENNLIADTAVKLIAVDKIALHYELFQKWCTNIQKTKIQNDYHIKNKVPYLKLSSLHFHI
jgi:hypothetical protein